MATHDTAFVAPGATIIGEVVIGAGSSIWYNCVLRADVFSIRIGERTNVQDGSILHCDPPRPGETLTRSETKSREACARSRVPFPCIAAQISGRAP